ncbi:MAG: hypothetical protein QW815_01325 [Nitrososphaerota archaeon]
MIRDAATIPMYVAAILTTNYILSGLPNVKLFDMLVFLATYLHGVRVGGSVAFLTWLVYGTVNPYGAAPLPLLLVQISSEKIFVLCGYVARHLNHAGCKRLLWGLLGGMGALGYDFLTNIYVGVFFYNNILLALIMGIPFSVAHTLADMAFFGLVAPPITRLISRLSIHGVTPL